MAYLAMVLSAQWLNAATIYPAYLACDLWQNNPLGIDDANPHLSWQVVATNSSARALSETAYEIQAASSAALLASNTPDLWDSGEVVSAQPVYVPYGGKALASVQQIFWQVRVWDENGQPSAYSSVATWTMGLLSSTNWQGSWLVPSASNSSYSLTGCSWIWYPEGSPAVAAPVATRYFLKTIVVGSNSALNNATLLVTADNCYTAYINGTQVGTGQDYTTVVPVTVTAQLSAGTNILAIAATNTGTVPNPAGLIGELILNYANGTQTNIQMDATWKAANTLQTGWYLPGFNDSSWTNALVLGTYGISPWGTEVTIVQSTVLPIFRRQFMVNTGLQRALICICGLGQYELSANGVKVGNALMAPGWTMYNKTCLYDTLDITSYLTNGENALGVMLGNGMYNVQPTTNYTKFTGSFGPPTLIAQIYLFYTNGTSQVIPTDTNWLATSGPITYSHVYGGEFYDARLWPTGWNEAGFNTSGWSVATVTNGPGGTLRGAAYAAPPIVAMQTLQPIQTNVLSSSTIVYDLGQNATILATLTAQGQAGSAIQITPAELTNSDGTVNRGSVGGGTAFWQYTLAGTGLETWTSRFFYHGCRYLQVNLVPASGSSQLPSLNNLSGVVIQSASTNTGSFSCSFPLFNNIRTIIRWAEANNMCSILTDCPHRERLGWLEEGNLMGPSMRYDFDTRLMVANDMQAMADSQTSAGLVPDIAPEVTVFSGGFRDSPEWGSSVILLPWEQYLFTGDDTLMRTYYSVMTNYFQYLNGQAVDYFLNYPNGLGDWYDIGSQGEGYSQDTPVSLTADFYYCLDAQILGLVAAEIGKTNDAAQFNLLATNIGTAFNSEYWSSANGYYSTGSQTAQAMPLYLGIVSPANQAAVLAWLIANVDSLGMTSGEVGHRYLLRALTDNGRPDIVYTMHSGTSDPGYGYIISLGNTTMTEAWDGNTGDSLDHFMFGHIVEWFYHDLAGIQWVQSAPGFRQVVIKPAFVGGITWANASYNCILGPIVSDWTLTNNQATLDVTIPVGATGSVCLPMLNSVSTSNLVTESGTTIWQNGAALGGAAAGVTFNQVQGSGTETCLVWTVGSGSYQFAWNILQPLPATPTGLTATAGNAEVILSWNASAGATNYIVQRSTTGSSGYATIASPATNNYTDMAVTNGTTYYYEVAAADVYGESTNSSWVSATPIASTSIQTNYFIFSPTPLANGVGPSNPSSGAATISGSSLVAGNAVVCDVIVSNTSGTTGDNWGAINLNQGGFFGLTGAMLGGLVRTGTGGDQCQMYTNGVAGADFPGSSEVRSNRLRITLYVAATGSTTNLGWKAELDQGLTGSFTSTLSGTNLTFPGNSISLTFSAYQAAETFVQYPIPVNTTPSALAWRVDGSQIHFSWPLDHIGWTLQAQTNSIGTNWVAVAGSNLTNEYTFSTETNNQAVFFRLFYP
jgi:hypothetical protein